MSDATRDWLGDSGDGSRPDPVRAARGHARPALPRRFYTEAGFAPDPGGFRLTLDGRPANTPARHPLVLPTPALAERVAAEWGRQVEAIDPATMPLTRLANTAIDGVAPRRAAVAADLAAYAGTDLLAYRAGEPERLVAAQAAAWDPVLAWARDALGARLILSEGVMHVTQPPETVRALSEAVAAVEDPFRLAALHTLTTLSGSLLLALAVLHGRLDPAEAWEAAHVDETYQAAVWGRDAEAEARLAARRAEFEAAAGMIAACA
ncbi:ATP12 family protein [Methylobacterium sp. NEAU 140]|uniref:ATP12 family chaperone protein n=1 Tax=Methylobacterium sp. NEAU 140 TaxID=3064945 RepID=UPI002735F649|nr:ATP12 family protein [Methylobacterium sp. NEAU 140]MDP4024512.1 ATP12 family protein [Methylobacterium sp. NEAU 140]